MFHLDCISPYVNPLSTCSDNDVFTNLFIGTKFESRFRSNFEDICSIASPQWLHSSLFYHLLHAWYNTQITGSSMNLEWKQRVTIMWLYLTKVIILWTRLLSIMGNSCKSLFQFNSDSALDSDVEFNCDSNFTPENIDSNSCHFSLQFCTIPITSSLKIPEIRFQFHFRNRNYTSLITALYLGLPGAWFSACQVEQWMFWIPLRPCHQPQDVSTTFRISSLSL